MGPSEGDWCYQIENDEKNDLLTRTFIEFEQNNEKKREYHVDTHPRFITDE